MRFHGNQLSWALKYLFINLCFKYHSPGFICFFTMLAPVIKSRRDLLYQFLTGFGMGGMSQRMDQRMKEMEQQMSAMRCVP